MTPPVVVNLREDTLRVETAMRNGVYVYIGRPSWWGNPFTWKVSPSNPQWVPDRAAAIRRYEEKMRCELDRHREAILALEGKVLGCYCKPLACHGDVLVKLWHELTGTAL